MLTERGRGKTKGQDGTAAAPLLHATLRQGSASAKPEKPGPIQRLPHGALLPLAVAVLVKAAVCLLVVDPVKVLVRAVVEHKLGGVRGVGTRGGGRKKALRAGHSAQHAQASTRLSPSYRLLRGHAILRLLRHLLQVQHVADNLKAA